MLYWSIRAGNLHTSDKAGLSGGFYGAGVFLMLFMWLIGGWALLVLRYPKTLWIIITYTIILFALSAFFLVAAFNIPSNAKKIQGELRTNCTDSTN